MVACGFVEFEIIEIGIQNEITERSKGIGVCGVGVLLSQAHEPLAQLGNIDIEALEVLTKPTHLANEILRVFAGELTGTPDKSSGLSVARRGHGLDVFERGGGRVKRDW